MNPGSGILPLYSASEDGRAYTSFSEFVPAWLCHQAFIPTTTQFDFYQGKLYRISATFDASRFNAMQEAFTGKYGRPSSATVVDYQNAFGAAFTGSVVSWDNNASTITLRQYGGGTVENSGLEIQHKAIAAQASADKPQQPSKDL